jgi:hypothetical protein
MAVLRALGEVAVLPLPCVSMASPCVVPPAMSAGWLLVSCDPHNDPRAALAYAGAVWAVSLVAVRRCSEPVPALRELLFDHAGWWFPFLRVDGACGRVVQRFVDQWRLLLVAMTHRLVSRRLVQCLALLQQLRRIGQGHVRANCLEGVPVHVQNQESLGSVFPADFRTYRRKTLQSAAAGLGMRRRCCGDARAIASLRGRTNRCSARGLW